MRYLLQKEALEFDKNLLEELKYELIQLIELSGFGISQVISRIYPVSNYKSVLVCCGPGNNGGDALVAARHLKIMGYDPKLCYPKSKERYKSLHNQCRAIDIPEFPIEQLDNLMNSTCPSKRVDLILDGVFGFSFQPPIRQPYDELIEKMASFQKPICSIDVPSGWIVDDHEMCTKESLMTLKPDSLISLGYPKRCAFGFKGNGHYLTGRFIPDSLYAKFKIPPPVFENNGMFTKIYE